MNIAEKIKEIRMQPEHIRLRWVWGSVTISMLFIFIIWFFSITVMFKNETKNSPQNSDGLVSDLKSQLEGIKAVQPSLEEYIQSQSPTTDSNEAISPTDTGGQPEAVIQNNLPFAQENPTTEPAPSSNYTDLQNQLR